MGPNAFDTSVLLCQAIVLFNSIISFYTQLVLCSSAGIILCKKQFVIIFSLNKHLTSPS